MTDVVISPVLLDRPKSAFPERHPYFSAPVRGRNRHGRFWRIRCEVIGCPWKISARYKQDALVDAHDHRAEHIRAWNAEQAKAGLAVEIFDREPDAWLSPSGQRVEFKPMHAEGWTAAWLVSREDWERAIADHLESQGSDR